MTKQRVIFYIDGFNFYFGLKEKKWKQFYWIDFVKLCDLFTRPHQELIEVNYFTAIPKEKGKKYRLDLLLTANKQNPLLNIYFGKYLDKSKICYNCQRILKDYEEKQTDVNIAVKMIRNVVLERNDISVLVSADSDLIPSIDFIREYDPNHKIFVYFPPNRYSFDLKNKANNIIKLEYHQQRLQNSVLPDEIILQNGYVVKRPDKWR